MNILITGAAGMVGRKLTDALVAAGTLAGQPITGLTLADVITPIMPVGVPGAALSVDLADPTAAAALIESRPDVIYHLAAIVSGEAEADLHKGYAVNLHGTIALLDAIAGQSDYCPRVIFTSSIAVFGAPLPDAIPDGHATLPLSSYGTQKAMGELMLSDYSRRGVIDGVSLRFPTICIRPGTPNAAASGFYSSILREPLIGEEAVLPVSDDITHWFASPRAAIGFLIHAAEVDLAPMGGRRSLNLPGVKASVGEMIAALGRVAGDKATALIRRDPDPKIAALVEPWPRGFDPARGRAMGFAAENSMDEIIRVHIEDELDGRIPVAED